MGLCVGSIFPFSWALDTRLPRITGFCGKATPEALSGPRARVATATGGGGGGGTPARHALRGIVASSNHDHDAWAVSVEQLLPPPEFSFGYV